MVSVQPQPDAFSNEEGVGASRPRPAVNSSRNVNLLDLARRRWDRQTIFSQPFEVKLDGLADFVLDFGNRRARSDTTRQVGHIGRIVAFGLFDHNGVTHVASLSQARLLQDAVLGAQREIVARFAWNSDAAGLVGVLELAVTSSGGHKAPTILMKQQNQGLLNPDGKEHGLLGPNLDARAVQKHLLWLSSNVFIYPFRDAADCNYHNVVTWAAKKAGASTIVGVLSGPVGWAVAAIAGLGGAALAGRPNMRKTATLVAQIHAMKVEALRAAKVSERQIFGA